ncbi:MAG: hypothetical protein Q9221_002519 [Calogaya cf. arnoldii]
MFLGAVLQAASFGVPQMVVGRIVCGWGNGFNTATTPLWISELIPAKARGRAVAIEGNLIAFGIVRAPVASQRAIIIAQIAWCYLLPESPRWLTKHGKHEEAIDILAQLKGKGIQPSDPAVIKQKKSIDHALALEEGDGPWRFMEIFKNRPLKIRRRFILAIWLQAMQQLSSINVLVYYFPHTLTTDIGMDYKTSLQVGAGLADTKSPPSEAKASLLFFFGYEAIFAFGWLPIPWLYPPEIMPLRHRTHSAALATASDWIFNYMIVQITPIAIANIRWKTYMIFFVLNIWFAIIVWLVYPETSGWTLEEIDLLYTGNCDRLFVVDKRGVLLPGFRSRMGREGDADSMVDDGSETSSNDRVVGEKAVAKHREMGV